MTDDTFTPAQSVQVPKAWFCFVPSPPGEEEPLRIRAWTTDADRAKRIGEIIGREFEPLYASQPSPAATVETPPDWKQDQAETSRLPRQHLDASKWPSKAAVEASHARSSAGNDDLAIIEEFVRRNVGGQPALDAIARLRAVPQPLSMEDVRQLAEISIRTFCQSLGAGAVTISSDGVERIYYAGISLKALSVAVAMAVSLQEWLTSDNPAYQGSEEAQMSPPSNLPGHGFASTVRSRP